MVKISVIIPVYNSSNYIKKTINSVYNQSLDDLEVVCVNDGSTDNSLEILKNLNNKYDTLKVISQKNQGPGKARNVGLDAAEGEFVAFLDADDIFVDNNALEKMYKLAIKENLNVVSANLIFLDKNYKPKTSHHHYESGDYVYFDEYGIIDIKDYGIPYGFTKAIFNLDFLLKNNIKFPTYKTGEDPIFFAKVFVNESKMGAVPLNLYGYNHTVGGGVNNKINDYGKKKQYLTHFKIVCDILSSGGLQNISDNYKDHLFMYLIWSDNVSDVDLFIIFNELYGDVASDYFDKTNEYYIKFIISYKFYFLKHSDSNDFFNEVKNEFEKYNVELIPDIQYITLKRYLLVINSNSLEEFKSKYNTLILKQLKLENKSLLNKNKKLNSKNKDLKKDFDKQIKLKKELFSSSSWKLTKPIRNSFKLIKKIM